MAETTRRILSPFDGVLMPLDQTPDAAFAGKLLGDGVAIRPEEGVLRSPVDGVVSSVAPTCHAYGFTAEDGVEVLVHVGIDTVKLKGEGFRVLVKEGDRVRAGDPVAEVDLGFLRAQGYEIVTPVVMISGADGWQMTAHTGRVQGGRDAIVILKREEVATEPPAGNPRRRIGFDFLQRLGKSLMAVIAVMPAAGVMLSLGKLLQMADVGPIMAIGGVMEQIGWAVIGNLNLLFAAAIGGSWAKDRAGGAFAAVLGFVLINAVTGAAFGITADMLLTEGAVVRSIFGQELAVADYFTLVLGRPALNMGVFAGIIAGFAGGVTYNRYYSFRRLPDALAFFNGKRFVPLMAIVYSAGIALLLSAVWPVIQGGINVFGVWIATSAETSPVLAPFLYGTLERLLLPFGLHHMLTIPMNYTSFGGEYLIRTGAAAGTVVYGQDPLWLAWVTDLISLRAAGNAEEAAALMAAVTPGRFKVGQMIGSTGLLLGFALAMYRCVPARKRRASRSMFLSAGLAVLLTGVTEPAEFMFMFCAPALYAVYALLQGCAFALAGVVDLRLHAFGLIELLTRVPMSLRAGLGGDIARFAVACAVFLGVGFVTASVMIRRFGYATPGRTEDGDMREGIGSDRPADSQAERIIALLGGRSNILDVDACMTRLRVTVRDAAHVAETAAWKEEGAMGLIVQDGGVQAIFGPKADVLKSDINDLLEGGAT